MLNVMPAPARRGGAMTRLLLGLIAVAALTVLPSRAVLAHPGHAHKVMGTVAVVSGNHVEVKDAAGKVTMHMLDAKTKIKRGKQVVQAADIKVGDRIVISSVESKDTAGKAVTTVTEVQLGGTPVPTAPKKG
jgi:hypothetical protein